MSDVILMYHRVCERAGARPWFARGTAVTPGALERQLKWLVDCYDVVPLRALLADTPRDASAGREPRPRAALTFDDGYADVVREALPVCQALDVVGTVFPVRGHLAGGGRALWFDAYYRILEAFIGPDCEDDDPLIEGSPLSSWVRGPYKDALQAAAPTRRHSLLDELAERLGVKPPRSPELYLSEADLHRLVDLGWGIGAHGVSHTRFTALDDETLREELACSLAFVGDYDHGEVVLAYPDGAHDARVHAFASAAGVRWALTVSAGPVRRGEPLDPLSVPRYFCRGESAMPNPALGSLTRSAMGARCS